MLRFGAYIFAIPLCAIACLASAQTQNPTPPRPIEGSQVDERRQHRDVERPDTVDIPLPRETPETDLEQPVIGVLAGVELRGVTVYEPNELAPLYEPMLARQVTAQDIQNIVQSITDRYREDGYILSRALAPAQDLDFGILRIDVVEGYIDQVTFEGPVKGRPGLLTGYADKLRALRPLTQKALEHYVILMNDLPGVSAEPALRRIDDATGSHELIVTLGYDPFSGLAAIDNKGTQTVGRDVAELSVNFNSAFGLQERTSVYFFTVPSHTRELLFIELQQEHVINDSGTLLGLDAWRSTVESGDRLKDSDLDSRSDQVGFYVTHPVQRSRDFSLFLSGSFDARNSEETLQGRQTFDDRVRSIRARVRTFFTDDYSGENLLIVTGSKGLDILDASPEDSPNLSRRGGKADYLKIDGEYIRWQGFGKPWSGELGLRGQRAATGLLSSEEFRIGGSKYGRAYDPSELAGDSGIAGYVELKHDLEHSNQILQHTQLYAFYDLGKIWNTDPVTGTFAASIASAGMGVQFTLPGMSTGIVELAKPLTRPVFEEGMDGNDLRLFGRFFIRF